MLSLSPLDGPYGPNTNTVKNNFAGGKMQNIVNVLMAVFYNSFRFHLIYLAMFPPEKRRIIWVLTVDCVGLSLQKSLLHILLRRDRYLD